MNLTVFAGTFNPIHTAHLVIAEFVRAELNLEKILFIPSYNPPQKNINHTDYLHRYNMVAFALKDNAFFDVSDIEEKLSGISYSYNTISELYSQNPDINGKINFIIGADAFNNFRTWYEYEKLAKILNFIVVDRPKNLEIKDIIENINIDNISYKFVNSPKIDISSSLVRKRIHENKSIKYIVPEIVEKYIIENKLYLS